MSDRARVERILGQWLPDLSILDHPTGASDLPWLTVARCVTAVNHDTPHKVSPAVTDAINKYRSTSDFNVLTGNTMLDNIVGIEVLKQMTPEQLNMSAGALCTKIQPELHKVLHDHYEPMAVPQKLHGEHASLLFSAIHGRLLCRYYNLSVAPDVPGVFTALTHNSVILPTLRDLLFRAPFFNPLIPDIDLNAPGVGYTSHKIQDVWYQWVATLGGLGLASQLFVLLPIPVIGFWSWLSDEMFQPKSGIDVEVDEIVLDPTAGIDRDYLDINTDDGMPNEPPVTDAPNNGMEVAADARPSMADLFFKPPLGDIDTLRTYVISAFNDIKAKYANNPPNGVFMGVLDSILEQLEADVIEQPQWEAIGRVMEHDHLNVSVSNLYAYMRGVVSPADMDRRLKVIFNTTVYTTRIHFPRVARSIYGQMLRLQDYGPEPAELNQRLEIMTRHMPANEQDYLQRVVYSPPVQWYWGPDTPTLNQRVLEMFGLLLTFTPNSMRVVFSDPSSAQKEDDKEEPLIEDNDPIFQDAAAHGNTGAGIDPVVPEDDANAMEVERWVDDGDWDDFNA